MLSQIIQQVASRYKSPSFSNWIYKLLVGPSILTAGTEGLALPTRAAHAAAWAARVRQRPHIAVFYAGDDRSLGFGNKAPGPDVWHHHAQHCVFMLGPPWTDSPASEAPRRERKRFLVPFKRSTLLRGLDEHEVGPRRARGGRFSRQSEPSLAASPPALIRPDRPVFVPFIFSEPG